MKAQIIIATLLLATVSQVTQADNTSAGLTEAGRIHQMQTNMNRMDNRLNHFLDDAVYNGEITSRQAKQLREQAETIKKDMEAAQSDGNITLDERTQITEKRKALNEDMKSMGLNPKQMRKFYNAQ